MPKSPAPPKPAGRPVTTDQRNRRRNGELKPVTAYVHRALWRALRVHAVQHDLRMSDMVAEAIERYLRPAVEKGSGS